MANVPISGLPAAVLPLTGTELVPLVQSGATKQTAVNNIVPVFATLEQYGGGTVGSGVASNTAALNALIAAGKTTLMLRDAGTYHFETKPSKLEDMGTFTILAPRGIATVVTRGWTSSGETEAVFHAYGATTLYSESFAAGTADNGSYGGSIIRLEAKASSAPDFSQIDGLYGTSYANVSAKVISAFTAANPGVATSVAHGLATGDSVTLPVISGGTWSTLARKLYTVTVLTPDTFSLSLSGTPVNTSGLGTYTANSATVKKALCCDAVVSIDGSARQTGAIGVRGVHVTSSQLFGGRQASILVNGAIGLEMDGTTTSDAGWLGTVKATGTAAVPNYYINMGAGSVSALALDYALYTTGSGQVQDTVVQTANTAYTNLVGPIGGAVTRLGTKNSGPGFIILPNGMALQWTTIAGVNGSYANFNWPYAFYATPTLYGAVAINSSSTSANAVVNGATTTLIQVAGSNLSAGGDAIIWGVGQFLAA